MSSKRLPDGSLCRITSSAKHLVSNVRIIKVPGGKPTYRLEIINPIEEEKIPTSSDEETSEDEFFMKNIVLEVDKEVANIVEKPNEETSEDEFPIKNIEIEVNKKVDNIVEKPNEENEKNIMGGHIQHKGKKELQKRNDYHEQKNTLNNSHKEYKDYEYDNRHFNSSTSQDFKSNANPNLAYENDNFNLSTMHLDPEIWIRPPIFTETYFIYPRFSLPHQLPVNPSLGSLGDHPIAGPSCDQTSSYPMASNFQPNTNNAFMWKQTPMYSPTSSSSHNSFVHNQSSSFFHRSSSYPRNQRTDKITHRVRYRNGYHKYHSNNKFAKRRNK